MSLPLNVLNQAITSGLQDPTKNVVGQDLQSGATADNFQGTFAISNSALENQAVPKPEFNADSGGPGLGG